MKIMGGQSIPSLLLSKYLGVATAEKIIRGEMYVRKRYPFKMPKKGKYANYLPSWVAFKAAASPLQRVNRTMFSKCIQCFKTQPPDWGYEPPYRGPRSREWWYNAAIGSGLYYINYFIKESFAYFQLETIPPWCSEQLGMEWQLRKYYPTQCAYRLDHMILVGDVESQVTRVLIPKPKEYSTLHLYVSAVTYIRQGWTDPIWLIAGARPEPLWEGCPTWEEYPTTMNVIYETSFPSGTAFTPQWVEIQCPDVEIIEIYPYGDKCDYQTDAHIDIIGRVPYEGSEQYAPYWTK